MWFQEQKLEVSTEKDKIKMLDREDDQRQTCQELALATRRSGIQAEVITCWEDTAVPEEEAGKEAGGDPC